jgi:prepilin peptidase CpaA
MIWVALVLLIVATVCDLRTRTIPDWISLVLAALGLAGNALLSPVSILDGLMVAGLGLAVGAIVGLCLFGLARFGGGDAKLIAALGAVLGPVALLGTLFWMALAGAALAIGVSVRGQRDLAYVPAIAIGLLIQAVVPAGFWSTLLS